MTELVTSGEGNAFSANTVDISTVKSIERNIEHETTRTAATAGDWDSIPTGATPTSGCAGEARALLASQSHARTLNAHREATVKAMAEAILPRTETPGAADVGASEFIDLILTEWSEEADRKRFLAGIADVDARSNSVFGKDFVDCQTVQQSQIWLISAKNGARRRTSERSAGFGRRVSRRHEFLCHDAASDSHSVLHVGSRSY